MNIIVAGRHIDVTEALRARVIEKVGRLSRYFDQVQKAQVWLRVEPYPGRNQVAEVTLWADGVVLRGEEASGDMYASIDLVVAKLEKQISKFRGKLIERKRTLASRRKQQAVAAADAAIRRAAAVEEVPPEEDPAGLVRIARRKRFELKPMTAEDAAVQMELLGHAFFVFRNADTLEINVVYRRADGSYGLIEPEG
jgi:putative sigma-54 modulation protein